VLYTFTGGSDGSEPEAGLIRDSVGNLYGTTLRGGNTSHSCPFGSFGGCGVVFKLDPSGHETVLYAFTGGADGSGPLAGLIPDSAGNLYGTTYEGGLASGNPACPYGCGVVFKLGLSGNETVLYSFTGGSDGALPGSTLIRDAAGNLYGTAAYGGQLTGSRCSLFGCGVVFKLDLAGNETLLYSFNYEPGGAVPEGRLIRDAAGNLYGTSVSGGPSHCLIGDCGVVFRLSPAGTETALHTFTGGTDGGSPYAGLLAYHGYAYGEAFYGGAYGSGVVFKVTLP